MSEVDKFLDEYEKNQSQGQAGAGQQQRPRTEVDDLVDAAPSKKVGAARSVADSAVGLGASLLTGAQMLTNVAGADNAASQALGQASDYVRGFESEGRRDERAARARKIEEAEQSGSTWREIGANLGAFAEAPIDTTIEAIGTSAPTLLAAALARGRGGVSVPATMGAAQGAGAVKGSIYEQVEQEYLKAGASPEEAAERAAQAQAYGGDNAGQIAIGAGLGALAGSTGIESAVGRMLGREAGDAAAQGVVKSAAMGAATEAPIEALQGGQERLAGNVATQNEGFDTPLWQGVAGAAALEGVAGGAAGGGFGAVEGFMSRQPAADPLTDIPADDPTATGGEPAPEVPPASPGMAPGAVPEQYRRETLGADPAQPAVETPASVVEPTRAPTPSERMGIDPNTGPLSTAAAIAVDTGTTDQLAQQAALQQAAEAAEQAQKQAGRQRKPAPEGVDPETGEIMQQGSLLADDPARQLQERMDYLRLQASITGWTSQMVRERESVKARMDELGITPAPRDQVQSRAEDAAAQALASGGTEADATRAATDTLIDGMATAPDIEIASDAPAAVAAARVRAQAPEPQADTEQTAAEPPAADIQAVTRKQIPQMTDAEIEQAITHYGPKHKRTNKLQRELEKRRAAQPQPEATSATTTQDAGEQGQPQAGTQADPQTAQQQADVAGVAAAPAETAPTNLKDAIARVREQKKAKQADMPRQDFDSSAGVGKVSAVKDRYGDKFGVSWASTSIADADSMEEAAAIARAVAESGAENIADMREVAQRHIAARREQPQAAPQIEGRDRGDGWAEFTPESGTLSVPRADMPQIKAEHRGAMVNFLNARGIAHQEDTVPAASLKPTQAEFSRDKVQQAREFTGGNRSILVSADGHVLDGHHQWMAARDAGEDVKVIRLDAPIRDLLQAAHEFPSSTTDQGAAAEPAKAEQLEITPADTSDPWSFVESYRAADGFEADIKSRQGVSGATVFGAFNKDGLQLFGNQLFPSADDVKAAIDPTASSPAETPKPETNAPEGATTKPANVKEGIEQARKKKAKEKAAKDAAASTAPEHRAVGVDDRELSEIVSEFKDAQSAMLDGDFKMHHLFDPPAKGEIVRLQDKVKVYNKDHGWMTPAEAKARIAEWKQHAAKQGDKNRMENSNRVVLSLFDYTGKWSQPWEEAGYQVYRFDIQQESMAELMGEDVNIGDVHNFGHEYFADLFGHFDGNDVYAILAACPCTDFASSGARHFAAKDKDGRTVASVKLVHQTLATVEYFKPAVWAIENPVGRIEKLGGLPPWRLSFDPNHLGDPYTKKTLLWGRFNADLPIAPVEPTEGSKMHSRYGGSSIATKNARSATPEGFAYGFFMANNAIDNPVMAISNKYDRLDREAIKAAMDAGLTEAQIDSLVEDHYYMDMDDEAANNALREAAREATQEAARSARRPQPGDEGYTLLDARNDLIAARTKVESQGLIANDRDMQRVRQLEQLVKDMEEEQTATSEQSLSQQLAGMSNADLSALIDEVINEDAQVADTAKPVQKRKRRTSPKKAEPKPRQQITEAEATDIADGAEVDRTAGEIAKSLGYNVSSAGMEAIKGLTQLFGGNGRLNSGLTFDEDTYAKAKPHFQAMLKDAQAAGKDIKDFIRLVLQQFGSGVKPYIIRFANDQRDEVTNERPADGATDQGGAQEVRGGRGNDPQPGAAPADSGDVAARQPADGEASGEAESAGRPSVREPRADVAPGEGAAQGRAAGDGRTRAGGARASDAGAGAAGAGRAENAAGSRSGDAAPVTSPAATGVQAQDLHIDNPLEIVGGTPVQRFNRNRAALELLQTLEEEGRQATPEEQRVLAGYIGWGSFGQELFQGTWDRPVYKDEGIWKERGEWLRETLGESAWKSAQRSITNAHYTDPPTVMAMWDMVRRMGFTGGKVLEPSMGTGNFFSMMPADIKARSQLTGIELDETTGAIAKHLFPKSNIRVMGYEQSKTPDNFYDLVIGNWPFENTPIADRRYNKLNPMLHDYFFLKTLDQVRPGGLVIGITSAGSMDKQNTMIRREMARKAELVASIRLPSGAFEEYAGTKVVTDIVVLRKRPERLVAVPADATWVETGEFQTPSGQKVRVNQHYLSNPQSIIGTLDHGHGTTTFRAGMIVHRPDNMAERLRQAVELVPENAMRPAAQVDHLTYYANETGERHGALSLANDRLMVAMGDQLVLANDKAKYELKDAKKTAAREQQLRDAVELRRLHTTLVDAERRGDDAKAARRALKAGYERFVADHGPLRESFALAYMERIEDPFFAELAALENDDGTPSAVMTRSTTRGKRQIDNPNIRDAYVLARNQAITPSLDDIARIANKSPDEVRAELLGSGVVFESPAGDIVPSDIYLSGNVREKMREAVAALEEGNTAMQANIDALQEVMPEDVPYFNIETKLGATWVPPETYAGYIAHMLGRSDTQGIDVSFRAGRWKVKLDHALNASAEASANYGTPHYSFSRLAQAAMSNQVLRLRSRDSDGNEYYDAEKSEEVNSRLAKIREDFGTWLWSDPERRVDLEREYNESRNAWATPRYDGSFLTFEGMALTLGKGEFNLREHQANAIWRAIVNRRSLNAHEVGTGKTFTMGGIAIESRRYGIARKPVILAHNANSATVAKEIRMMYPSARVLYVDNLEPKNRDIRLRQIANDDWDAIVIPHSLIDRLALREETLMQMAADDIAALEAEFFDAAAEDGISTKDIDLDSDEDIGKIRSVTAKELAKARKRIIESIKKQGQQASKEGAVTFEDLGIDMILVDEVHEFKKPPIVTRMQMKGLNTQVSNRSIALQFLTRYVRQMNNGGNVHTFTGTPITNTITEIYHQMRYVMESEMEAANVADWDGWFGSFATEVQDVELSAAGDYEMVTRLAGFVNVPELRQMVGQYMDTVFADDMPEMQPRKTKSGKQMGDDLSEAERAELLNGRTEGAADRPYKKVVNESSDMTDEQQRIFRELQGYAQDWRNATGKQRREWQREGDPRSPIITEGIANKASFDVRLLDESLAGMEGKTNDDPNSKASRVVANTLDIYNSHPLANQVIFAEMGFSKSIRRTRTVGDEKVTQTVKVFSTVHDIVERLVQGGIPREQIAIVDGKVNKEKRREIAEAMNDGRIRVVIGSTDTLGVGVNMQRNLRAMHHLDAPYMPGELEQRNGRGQRQGNQWNTVMEYRYMTDRLDGRRWQILAVKQRFITAFMKANTTTRVIEGEAAADEQSDILESFSEAAGDPRVLQRVKLQKKVESLQRKERLYTQGIADMRRQIRYSENEVKRLTREIDAVDTDAVAGLLQAQRDNFTATIDGTAYDTRKDAVAALEDYLTENMRVGEKERHIGTYGGHPLLVEWSGLSDTPTTMVRVGKETFAGKGIAGVEASMRNLPRRVENMRQERETAESTIANMQQAMQQPFGQAEDLARTVKQLEDLEADLEINPVPPPAWLRQGAPIDSEVYRNKKPYIVTGHRYSQDGWFVMAEDAKGATVIPYMEVTDSVGMPVYEEREFVAPEVVSKDNPQGLTDADRVPEQGAPDIRRSFAGRRAATSDPMALESAQLRIAGGENAETVRQETGWHRGNDGKWRFEISDDQATLKTAGATFGEAYGEAYANAFADGRSTVTVGDLLQHDQLFAAYPALADIPVSQMPEGERALARLQRRATGMAVQVQPSMRRNAVVSALLHELQHGIQTIEGFATGGSAKRFVSDMDRTGAKTYRRLAGEVEARNTQTRQRMTPEARQRYSPELTADVPASDVIVTFNGRDLINGPLPGNAETRPAMTQGQVVRAFQVQFPKLVPAVRTMLSRGAEGKRGGLVLVDSADPLMIARAFSKKTGRALTDTVQMFSEAGSVNGFYDPQSGLTFLVTPNLDAVTAPAVLLHEMVHGQQRKRIDARAGEMLMNRAKFKDPELRAFLDRVAARMVDAGEGANIEEAAPYIVEQAVIEGRSQGYALADNRFLSWVDKTIGQRVGDLLRSMLASIRSWMLRNGMKPGEITVDDLVGYAMTGVQRAAEGQVDGGDVAFSRDAITNTSAFKRWFGDSKVVDADGNPLVVYHGTGSDFSAFSDEFFGDSTGIGDLGEGFYFTSRPEVASSFAEDAYGDTPNVMPVYLSLQNPATNEVMMSDRVMDALQDDMGFESVRDILMDMGYDGIIWDHKNDGGIEYVAFRPEQIKSAVGNRGTFDPTNPDIRFSRTGVKQLASRATLELNRTFNAPGKLHWWHKTVGTMYNLAERSPAFKPVFEAAQGFIDDVAHYATDAAEMAPKLLPRLETWRDILRRPISAGDNKAISRPVFEGTLVWARDGSGKPVRVDELEAAAERMTTDEKVQALLNADKIPAGMLKAWQALPEDQFAKMIDSRYESQLMKPGVVWSDAELRSIFNLSDSQIELYREFRAAIDRSLDTMARADMLRFVGEDANDLRDAVMDAEDVQAASRILVNRLQEMALNMPDRETQLMQLAHGIIERAARVGELQAEGYAPLSRFGKYTVDVVVDGERQYFGLFETRREANKMAEAMKAEFGANTVTQGTLSDESFKLFAGVTPETLELFGNMLGLDSTGDSAQDQAFQQYLRLTKTNRSAMRRLIHRKGVAGYSEDVGRVLASFVYSNARQTAAGLNIGELGEAVNQIPKEQGELKDAAVRLSEYIKNPQEEAQAMRGMLFAQYLGGSVASAFVNLTQPVQVTFPWLSQYAGARGSAKEISRAVKQMSTRGYQYEADLARALKDAEDDGTVSPQEVHQLMAQARGSGSLRAGDGTRAGEARAFTSNQIARLSLAWGKMFGAAEQANRRITFIAAYRVARDKGMPDPAAFARRAVRETQFVYSKASKMQWGRGAIGGTLMTFKTYSVSYIELMHRLWNQGEPGSEERAEGRKAAMLMVATLMLMGGVGGLPFMEDAEDLIDGAAQLMGYNFSTRLAKEQFLRDVFGDAMGEFIEKGVSGLPGAPMDVSGRLGMGNLIPGTGLFTERTSHTRDVLEILGPGGDFANRILSGGRQILGGDVGSGLLEISPVAVRNVAKGVDMAAHDMYRDTKGYKVLDTNILEAALKAGGFQPASVAKIQEANWLNQRAKNFYSMQAQEIRALWATGIFEGDQAKVQRARDRVAEWNQKNPSQPMIIRIPDVMRRVREMRKTKDERIASTAPRAMRAQMREDLARVRDGL